MPELPEVESARVVIERGGLHQTIIDVDDSDTWECRPHRPGDIRSALLGHRLTAANRRGKSIWCDVDGADSPPLGIHLGMSGRILVTGPHEEREGGDYHGARPAAQRHRKEEWFRFSLTFEGGDRLRLLDPRRLGRVRLDPDIDALGPDAAEIGRADFRGRVGRGRLPVKARLLDQSSLAGVGNLLADEVLWQARIDPRRPAGELSIEELDELRRRLRAAIRTAVRRGGVHTLEVVGHRGRGAHCPRCGAEMQRATVGSRTTWWCPREQT